MTQRRGVELDKLKRRMIRSVARLFREKKTEAEVWEVLKNICGANCKKLWDRMRSLTLKKLSRLLNADDRVDDVPSVARMTLTDWLLYDLVIVHEKIDIIDRDSMGARTVLESLFTLVQMFQVEGREGNDLADAWTSATVYYNSTGHQCSPMLMQRRWYQLKQETREKFYTFWFNYRGNARLLSTAKSDPPSDLHQRIASRYPEIITKPFPDWEERIEQKLVIMPEEFEVKMRLISNRISPPDENVPDVVIVEPKVDTITLTDSEASDNDNDKEIEEPTVAIEIKKEPSDETQTPVIVQVTSESQESLTRDIDITVHSDFDETNDFSEEIERLQKVEEKIIEDEDSFNEVDEEAQDEVEVPENVEMMPLIAEVAGAVQMDIDEPTTSMINGDDKVKDVGEVDNDVECFDTESQESILIDDDVLPLESLSQNVVTDVQNQRENHHATHIKAEYMNDNVIETNTAFPVIDKVVSVNPSVINELTPVITAISSIRTETNVKFERERTPEDKMLSNIIDADVTVIDDSPVKETMPKAEPMQESFNMEHIRDIPSDLSFADGIEFADDGIEFTEDDPDEIIETPVVPESEDTMNHNESDVTFDLKLLMNPVVYTTKLDHMIACKNLEFFKTVDGKDIVDRILLESKPTSTKSIKVDEIKCEPNASDLDHFSQNDSSDDSGDEAINDSKRVKLSSNLLRKPTSRTYNPIQLCKNPDFNTRLKRLTVGFFRSTRNRVLLKSCKPMTIDLSKAFESKLLNGTMYLKHSDEIIKTEKETQSESTASVLPSAVAVQSLMDTTDVDKILQEELQKRIEERNTVKVPFLLAKASVELTHDNSLHTEYVKNIEENTSSSVQKENDIVCTKNIKQGHEFQCTEKNTEKPVNVEVHVNNNSASKQTNVASTTSSVTDSNKTKVDKPIQWYKGRYNSKFYPSWFKKTRIETDKTDLLLTTDTLIKMLHILDPDKGYADILNKVKKWPGKNAEILEQRIKGNMSNNIISGVSDVNIVYPSNKAKDNVTKVLKVAPPKPPPKKKIKKPSFWTTCKPYNRSGKKKWCCWSRQKIEKMNGGIQRIRSKHVYDIACTCCVECREQRLKMESDVANYLNNMEIKNDFQKTINGNDTINIAIDSVVQEQHDTSIEIGNSYSDHEVAIANLQSDLNISNEAQGNAENNVYIVNNEPATVPEKLDCLETIQKDEINESSKNQPLIDVSISVQTNSPTPVIRVFSAKGHEAISTYKSLTNKDPDPLPPKAKTPAFTHITPKPKLPDAHKPLNNIRKDLSVPCSCRPNVILEQQRTLLVDGSNQCLKHKRSFKVPSKESRIYLNRRRMSLNKEPFYLGKDKILLSSVKMPKENQTPPPSEPPTISLPPGVQILLLPNGTLSYTIDPNVDLSAEQLATIPVVLGILQKQISDVGINMPIQEDASHSSVKPIISVDDNDLNDISSNEIGVQNEINTSGNEESPSSARGMAQEESLDLICSSNVAGPMSNTQRQSSGGSVLNTVSKLSEYATNAEQKITLDDSEVTVNTIGNNISVQQELPSSTSDNTINKNNDKSKTNEAIAITEKDSSGSNNANTITSRNLLSDLMEMSGIREDDIAPVKSVLQESTVTSISQESILKPLKLATKIPVLETPSLPLPGSSALSPTTQSSESFSAAIDDNILELYPVTSFIELKYACDNNARFFKLDLTSGNILPINVCIQKTPENAKVKILKPTDVIDLTDEPNVEGNESSDKTNEASATVNEPSISNSSFINTAALDSSSVTLHTSRLMNTPVNQININISSQIEPSNLTLLRPLSVIEKRRQEFLSKLSNNLKPLKLLQRRNHNVNILRKSNRSLLLSGGTMLLPRRKVNLNKIEAKIDLVDSDAPIEEEYLVDESSDSSDDEPLAKVAKRMRDKETNDTQVLDINVQNASERIGLAEIDAVDDLPATNPSDQLEPRPTQLVISDNAFNQDIFLDPAFLTTGDDDDEDSQEDCILGV